MIRRVDLEEVDALRKLSIDTFLESHGHSASTEDIAQYVEIAFEKNKLLDELKDPSSAFYFIESGGVIAGYSKVLFNNSFSKVESKSLCKLERIYLLKEFYGKRMGLQLLAFNVELAKKHDQTGMWLYTWVENSKAIGFYKDHGFEIIGSYDFKISDDHVNPNHLMLLTW